MTHTPKTRILIADDLRSSRMNIQNLLRHWGYDPVPCEDGIAARDALAAPDGPRIAILDWVMPGMTGPEVCKWIVDEFGTFVYTILLTSKGEQRDLVEGLTSGAHAYITKPARPAELESWIRVGLRMLDYEKELSGKSEALGRHAREMESVAQELALQLAETGKCDALAGMGAGLGTEIRLTTQNILDDVQTLKQAAQAHAEEFFQLSTQDFQMFLADLSRGLGRLQDLARQLENFNRQQKRGVEPRCEVNGVLKSAVDLCEASLGAATGLRLTLDQNIPEVRAVPEILQRATVQFLMAACANAPGAIAISTEAAEGGVAIRIETSGTGGPGVVQSAGLVADLEMLEQLGGLCRVEPLPEGGTRLAITLPAAGADA